MQNGGCVWLPVIQETSFRPTQPALGRVLMPLPNKNTIVHIHTGALRGKCVALAVFRGGVRDGAQREGSALRGMELSQRGGSLTQFPI